MRVILGNGKGGPVSFAVLRLLNSLSCFITFSPNLVIQVHNPVIFAFPYFFTVHKIPPFLGGYFNWSIICFVQA